MLTYGCAVLAAFANALASVLQRKANKDIPKEEELSLRLVRDLLHTPTWFGGIAAVTAGFLLQAVALDKGDLSVVEPILVLDLPLTVLLAWRMFHGRTTAYEWTAVTGMTAGLAGLIFCLSPRSGEAAHVPWWQWALGLGSACVVIAALVAKGRRTGHDSARAAIFGVATGLGFGVTAALMKGMTSATSKGFFHLFAAWETYLMVLAGAGSMYLLQNAVNAGRLVAAQPGITLADPVMSILWGVLIFGEQVRGGWWSLGAAFGMLAIVASVVVLARSPLLADESADESADEEAGDDGPPPDERPRRPATAHRATLEA